MYDAINIAVSGMHAQQSRIDVVSNNLSNVNTAGFKKSNVHFEDLMSRELQTARTLYTREQQNSYFGQGTAISNVTREFTQGDMQVTDRPLDLAIQGEGFFEVLLPDGVAAYTRAGSFNINGDGFLVNRDGYLIQPALRFPDNIKSVLVQSDGSVMALLGDDVQPEYIGHIELTNFVNASGLQPIGDNLYISTEASGSSIYSRPGEDEFGLLQQGAIESSNVNLVEEMTSLLMAQRGYELNAQVIQASNSILEVVNSLSR